jgi:hypothetical protein
MVRSRSPKTRNLVGGKMAGETKQRSLIGGLFLLAVMGVFQLAGGVLMLSLMYGVVVIIFRYAFHVELWNPFH